MTRDEILNMEAGRKLDALIAEKVMGFANIHEHIFPSGEKWWMCDTPRGKFDTLASFSTDISAAWEIAEKMRARWPDYAIGNFFDNNQMWQVSWGYDGYGWQGVEAETAPLAICRAALLAVMEQENK